MKSKKIRVMLRWMHIVFGLVIMCYVYSPFHELVWYQVLVKFIIIPVITLSGIWIWKFREINEWLLHVPATFFQRKGQRFEQEGHSSEKR